MGGNRLAPPRPVRRSGPDGGQTESSCLRERPPSTGCSTFILCSFENISPKSASPSVYARCYLWRTFPCSAAEMCGAEPVRVRILGHTRTEGSWSDGISSRGLCWPGSGLETREELTVQLESEGHWLEVFPRAGGVVGGRGEGGSLFP